MIIETLFPKSTKDIIEYDVLKLAVVSCIEARMLKLISLMKEDSHIQTMTPETLADLSMHTLGTSAINGVQITNEQFITRINGDSTYTETNFNDAFQAWTQDSRSYYALTKDKIVTPINLYMYDMGNVSYDILYLLENRLEIPLGEIYNLRVELYANPTVPKFVYTFQDGDSANSFIIDVGKSGSPPTFATHTLDITGFSNRTLAVPVMMAITGAPRDRCNEILDNHIKWGIPTPLKIGVDQNYMTSVKFTSIPNINVVTWRISKTSSNRLELVSLTNVAHAVKCIQYGLEFTEAEAIAIVGGFLGTQVPPKVVIKAASKDLLASPIWLNGVILANSEYPGQTATFRMVANVIPVLTPIIPTMKLGVGSVGELYSPSVITDIAQTDGVNVLNAYLYGVDSNANEQMQTMDCEIFFQGISYKMPANIDVRFTLLADTVCNSVCTVNQVTTIILNTTIIGG